MSKDDSNIENKTDVIVVGGGPAGISAAVTVARSGKKVILIERGKFAGSKNVFGGAIYTKPTKEIFPDFEKTAPLERKNIEHKYALLGEEDSTVISYRQKDEDAESYTVIRSKFDRWMAKEAMKEGVIVVEETVVRELILDENRVVGIKTELEDYYSDIVILADGVNSLLSEQIGLKKEIKPEDVALSVKEVFKIPEEKINERFNINDDEGCIYQLFGGPMLGMLGLGFIYTNENSVSIGLGITLNELIERKINPYDLLEDLKSHPTIAPLIKDGELLEYSAHLIPEAGYKKLPELYAAGVMVAGDAGMLVNNIHWEGTNLAMISGKLAGETAIIALSKKDFSEKTLSRYQEALKKSFIMKDLYTYREVLDVLHKKSKDFLGYYPQKINGFFKIFTSVDCIPKRDKYREFIKSIFTDRKIPVLFSDFGNIIKLIGSVLK